MNKTIAIFGGSFNPPGVHHRDIVEKLATEFDVVKVIPSGHRPDKETTNDIDKIHRATMVDLNFGGIADNVDVELFDLEEGIFTPNYELEEMCSDQGEIWHAVGADLIAGGGDGSSAIQKTWNKGKELWNNANFAVILRDGVDLSSQDLPPNHEIIEPEFKGSSAQIRSNAFQRKDVSGFVCPNVASYMERHNLYRGHRSIKNTTLNLDDPRPLIIADSSNPKAVKVKDTLSSLSEDHDDPNVIVVIGGDGFMLNTIRSNWRRRAPFFGINTGHVGFLLNSIENIDPKSLFKEEFILRFSPLLYVDAVDTEGNRKHEVAFNDTLIQAEQGRAGWFEISIDGEVKIDKMVADGALVATAAGSTAHARAMGANPVPVGSDILVVIGSNVSYPDWRGGANLPIDSRVTFKNADKTGWRKITGFADGVSFGEVKEMNIRTSRIAAAELLFLPHNDVSKKLAKVQFPDKLK